MSQDKADEGGLERVLRRYESSKGAADKRKETSKINMAKARAAKLAGARKKKEEEEVEVSESEDSASDESEYEEVEIIKPQKGKGKAAPKAKEDDKLAKLEAMMLMLAQQQLGDKKKKKVVVRKVAAKSAEAPAEKPEEPVKNTSAKAQTLKRNLLGFYS